jgi:hypothetical protein
MAYSRGNKHDALHFSLWQCIGYTLSSSFHVSLRRVISSPHTGMAAYHLGYG